MKFLKFFRSRSFSFKDIEELTGKMKQCAWSFQQALECATSKKCDSPEELIQDVTRLVGEIKAIENQILSNIINNLKLPVERFEILRFVRELDRMARRMEEALQWFSFRGDHVLPQELEKDFFLLFDSVIDPIEELAKTTVEIRKYFKKRSERQKKSILKIITGVSGMIEEARRNEERTKRKIFAYINDPVSIFHMIRLVEIVASICDNTENTNDLMRGAIYKK